MLFAIWRGKKCKIAYIYCAVCNSESSKVQNSLYLLCLVVIRRAQKCKIAYIYNEKSIYWPPESPDAPAPKLPLYTGDNSLNWTKEKNINETQQYDEVANLDFEASAAGAPNPCQMCK